MKITLVKVINFKKEEIEMTTTNTNKIFFVFLFFKDFIYLFMRDIERERGRDTGRGRSRLHAGSPMWDLIPDLRSGPGLKVALNR